MRVPPDLPDFALHPADAATLQGTAEGLRAARIDLWASLWKKVETVEEQVAERTAHLELELAAARHEIMRLRRHVREHALTRAGR